MPRESAHAVRVALALRAILLLPQPGIQPSAYWLSQALYVAAKLGIPDLVKDDPRTADDLASATKSHPRALYRLLRALASIGVFAEDDQRRFSLISLAECLLSDVDFQKNSASAFTLAGCRSFRIAPPFDGIP